MAEPRKRKPRPAKREVEEPEWKSRLLASMERLQDPAYVMKVIRECQKRGMIPKDKGP